MKLSKTQFVQVVCFLALAMLGNHCFAQPSATPIAPAPAIPAEAESLPAPVPGRHKAKSIPSAPTGFFGSGGSGITRADDVPSAGGFGRVESYRTASGRDAIPPVVLAFSSTNAASLPQLEEDLTVMTHIVDQALERGLGEEAPPSKMGVPLLYTGSSRSVRAIYLSGFGALFMIKVNMPLLPPATPGQEQSKAKAVDSDWDTARREVLGLDRKGENMSFTMAGSDVPFDAAQVETLKGTIIGALKNASNIRNLAPDETISIAVFGQATSESASALVTPQVNYSFSQQTSSGSSAVLESQTTDDGAIDTGSSSSKPNGVSSSRSNKAARKAGSAHSTAPAPATTSVNVSNSFIANGALGKGTILTMQAKKADVNAFAEGRLNLEQFTQKVSITAYAGNGYGLKSVNSWIQGR